MKFFTTRSALVAAALAVVALSSSGCSNLANVLAVSAQRNDLHKELAAGEQSPAAFSEDMRRLDRARLQYPL